MIDYTSYGIKFPSQQEKIDKHYKNLGVQEFIVDIQNRPYHIFCDILDMSFTMADKTVMQYRLIAPNARHRCQYAVYAALKANETAGNTRMTDSAIAQYVHGVAPESMSHIVDVVKTDRLTHYDETHHLVSFKRTYNAEVNIANNIKRRLVKPEVLNIDVNKYKKIDGNELTDEQMSALCMARDNAICMINGSAGCVDCDTEFFNGFEWKKISNYVNGDKVLQYNKDGSATLVEPLAYIKEPTDYLWHFETLRGLNQTICDNHRIIYETRNGVLKECNIHELMEMHLPNNKNFQGKFITAFNYEGDGIDLTEQQIRLMVATIADGTFLKNNKCRIRVKKTRKKERIRELLHLNGLEYNSRYTKDGYYEVVYYAPRREKKFTGYWYNCSKEQLKTILDEVVYWDGCIRNTKNGTQYKTFSTSIKESADFIQFAASSCGIRSSISKSDRIGEIRLIDGKEYVRQSNIYTVYFSNKTRVGLCSDNRSKCTKTPIEKVRTIDGYKYCFTVPSHMLVLRRKDCIFITGNCGKSFVTKAVVNMLEDTGKVCQLLTPTGISSKILRNYTHHAASTIHLYLTSVAECDVILIDEMSMVSVHLLSMLLTAVKNSPRLIFVADNAQLASISCGNIVQDLIDSGIVPRVELTKIFRYNTSGIVTLATDTRHGSVEHLTEQYPDYQFIQTGDDPIGQTVGVYDELLNNGYTQDDICILCPFKKRNGTDEINQIVSEKYNRNKTITAKSPLKIGDKVINMKNDYSEGENNFIANGDIGYLRSYSRGNVTVEFDFGERKIKSLQRIEQATALTIHKVQGSSFKVVIVYIDKPHEFFLTKNLIYTAITRAKEKLIIVGDIDAIKTGVSVSVNDSRNTWLKELLTANE